MVKETVRLVWKDMSIHIPPEVPLSLGYQIKYLAPGWNILNIPDNSMSSDDYTLIRSIAQRASIVSSSKETRAICIGHYGKNLESIKIIGDTIKKVANFSKRKDVPRKLAEENCEASIHCESLPTEVKVIGNVYYEIFPSNNLTAIGCFDNFYNFSNKYEHVFSKMFRFKD